MVATAQVSRTVIGPGAGTSDVRYSAGTTLTATTVSTPGMRWTSIR
jgi:hypothetical protein